MSRALAQVRGTLGDVRGRTFWIVIGCLVCQMGLGFTYVTRPLASEIIGALDITRAQFSAANAPQLFAQALASPLVGYLTVRIGASRVFGMAAALFTAAFFYFARIESLTGFYVSMAMLGLGAAGMGDIGVAHIVSQWVKRRRGLALGLAYTGSNLGGRALGAAHDSDRGAGELAREPCSFSRRSPFSSCFPSRSSSSASHPMPPTLRTQTPTP